MNIKMIIKRILGKKISYKLYYTDKIKKLNNMTMTKSFLKTRVYTSYSKLFNNVKFYNDSDYFFYSIDPLRTYYYDSLILGNLMLDYSCILENSIAYYEEKIEKMNHESTLYKKEKDLLNGLNVLIDREILLSKDENIKDSLKGLKSRKANSFKDALQRILFLNQILWQTNHNLNGLGRLDLILDSYYQEDLKKQIIDKQYAKILLIDFFKQLNKNFYYKSNSLSGDTGQIIIVGGTDSTKKYFCNDLTFMFIELLAELKLPDPKVLLRVSKNMPRELMKASLRCISTGIGCPLFANDDVIIPRLIEFGYSKADSYNYGTAACWEPYIPGKSFDQSNMGTILFLEPLNTLLNNETLNDIKNIDELLNKYYEYLYEYLNVFKNKYDSKKYSKDALLSLFIESCIEREQDIAVGGAIYNNYGFTSVGLANTVDSILIIEKYVFREKRYSFDEFNDIRKNNYLGYDLLLKEIKNYEKKYGVDDDNIIALSNKIIKKASDFFDNKRNSMGGKYKFGLSSPSYINLSQKFPASFDGRKNNEPFRVHISYDKSNGYTELINFASKLDYHDNRINGNVVDFFVTPSFINDNFEKFIDFLIFSIESGFYEMQMNVVSGKQLLAARKDPSKFPNLIVRVWGFSAYFKDLPNEYKDYIVERALKSESRS